MYKHPQLAAFAQAKEAVSHCSANSVEHLQISRRYLDRRGTLGVINTIFTIAAVYLVSESVLLQHWLRFVSTVSALSAALVARFAAPVEKRIGSVRAMTATELLTLVTYLRVPPPRCSHLGSATYAISCLGILKHRTQ